MTRVLYVKETDVKRFVVVDGAMNDLIRPVLYEAYHDIWPVHKVEGGRIVTADVVGPVCESGDFFAQERDMPEPQRGDLLAVMSAGAYGFVMASNYNSRARSPEILVEGAKIHVIRERDNFEDLVHGEKLVRIGRQVARWHSLISPRCTGVATTISTWSRPRRARPMPPVYRSGYRIAASESAATD